MSKKKVATFQDLERANDTEYATVDAYGVTVEIGSLSSEDLLEWTEDNEDPAKRKRAGLRLLVKSLVSRDEEGNPQRVTKENFDHMLRVMAGKSTNANNKVIDEALKLNGLGKAKGQQIPNVSSEGVSEGSPTDSPSQQATTT